jgi:homocysteine S-methyltransferase
MGQIGGDVALYELGGEIGLGAEVVEEGALRAGRLGDDLVDRGRVVTLIGHQPFGNLQDPFTGWTAVSGHISIVPDRSVCYNQTEQSETEVPMSSVLPQMSGLPVVNDGGLETDLIYHHGVELPDFAAFPLVDDERGRDRLLHYYGEYVEVARRAGTGVQLDTPTWRASPDWGERLGYSVSELARVNREAVALIDRLRNESGLDTFLVSGCLGPRGDGYVAGEVVDPDEAAAYHTPQIEAFAEAAADLVTVLTLTGTGEAVGIVRAARAAGIPVAVSFTVETDGRLPDGTSLPSAVSTVDAEGGPDYFMVNCAHPSHIAPGLADDGEWRLRIRGLRANASTRSHAELDAATELDEGDPLELARAQDALRPRLPNLTLIGGCCGTDSRHVAAMWATP